MVTNDHLSESAKVPAPASVRNPADLARAEVGDDAAGRQAVAVQPPEAVQAADVPRVHLEGKIHSVDPKFAS